MSLAHSFPPAFQAALQAALPAGAVVSHTVTSDIAEDGRFGPTFVALSDQHVAAGSGDQVRLVMPLAELTEARVDEVFGGGRLMLVHAGGERCLAAYTSVLVPEFAALCRLINDRKHGRALVPPDAIDSASCARCGAPLPDRGAECPLCVSRLAVFRRLVGLLTPYRWRVFALIGCTLAMVGSQLAQPYLTKLLYDDVVAGGKAERLPLYIGLMLACAVAMLFARLGNARLMAWLSGRIIADLRSQLHAAMTRLSMAWHGKRDSGELVGRVMNDTGELQHFLVDGLPYLFVNALMLVAIAAILISIDPWLTLVVMLPVPFLLGAGSWFWAKLMPLFHQRSSRGAAMHAVLGESIHGVKAVKAMAQEDRRAGQFDRANEQDFQVGYRITGTFAGFSESIFFLMQVGTVIVWYVACQRLSSPGGGSAASTFTFGDLLAFMGYIGMFYGPLQWCTAVINWMSNAFAGAERVFGVLDAAPEAYDPPTAIHRPKLTGKVEFRDVRFSYERGKEILKGVSFTIEPGTMVGLVGKSGAGKSTIINLVCRFFTADSGAVLIDGIPLGDLKLDQLRKNIGIVMQEPFLFNGTILDNIRYGLPEATFDQVLRAAKAANAHEFILDKPEGYDTVLGERGITLSGGERQRLSIARAILHDPPVLILDEATSAVDSETEAAIQIAIGNLTKGRTTIAIAHRLATLRGADRLLVVEDGLLVEQGTHEELLAKPEGRFAQLVKLQQDNNRMQREVFEL